MVQISWLIISVIMRKIRSLSTSPLEVFTLAFAVIAMATYLAQWDKPKCINVPTIVHLERMSDDPDKAKVIDEGLMGAVDRNNNPWAWVDNIDNIKKADLIFGLSFAIFGGLHCLSWNFNFPSTVERVMWRVAGVISLSIFSIIHVPIHWFDPNILYFLMLLLYGLARIAIIGISFSSLRLMPASVYITTWSKYLPNIQ